MNLFALLQARAAAGRPVRAGLIGAGKFGAMFLSQAPHTPGLEVTAIADLSPERARKTCAVTGWSEERIAATDFPEDGLALCRSDRVDVVIDATGSPHAGVHHALTAIENGKHIVMVNVEADVLAGPALSARARAAGTVYSMAYGDQPALTSELVDWARSSGFPIQAAGKGTKFLPEFNTVTPDDVWPHYGIEPKAARAAGMNAFMFNSFLDGTKSAIEMAAVANACDLGVPENGLSFHPCGVDDLAHVLRPRAIGGKMDGVGMVETVSSLERDGRPVFRDLRWGVYVVIEAPNAFTAESFKHCHLPFDSTGRYVAMYKPFHIVGLELGVSVLSAALRGEPTGESRYFRGDVAAVAKRDLKPGDRLDGEGGYTVWGRLMPAASSVAMRALPMGLAHNIAITRPVKAGQIVTQDDVEPLADTPALRMRRETEAMI